MLIGGWSVRTPAPVAAVVATGVIVFGLSACGGSSQTAHTPVATKRSVANCLAAQGIAAGEALVRSFSSARFLADSILLNPFKPGCLVLLRAITPALALRPSRSVR